jgi:hypothetical protein
MESLPKTPMSCNKKNPAFPDYAVILWTLSLLFFLRVIGQLIQHFNPVSWLPQFEVWQGSPLPYGFLFFSQLIILAVMIRITQQHASGCVQKNPSQGKWLLAIGVLCFVGMTGRLVIGLTNLSAHPWFHKFLPAFFHLVLATFVLLLAAFHMNWVAKNNKCDLSEDMQ